MDPAFRISPSTLQFMGVMTLTALSGMAGFFILRDERAGLLLTFAGYITGLVMIRILGWNRPGR